MVRIAIVEDDPQDLAQIRALLRQYEAEHGLRFSLQEHTGPAGLLSRGRGGFDLVFMDIDLPPHNGIDVAKQLRAVDADVPLVFITNMEQCAVNGYEVDALDFVVKPINHYRFSAMMAKALRRIGKREEKELVVRSASKIVRLQASQIHYVEVRDHLLVFHTAGGDLDTWGRLGEIEGELAEHDFVRCSSSYLVNLRHVQAVEGSTVLVAGDRLPISQRRRKAFYNSVTNYLSQR